MLKLDVLFSYTFRLKVLLLVDCAPAKLSFAFVVPINMGWIRVWMLLSHPQGKARIVLELDLQLLVVVVDSIKKMVILMSAKRSKNARNKLGK